MHDPMTVAFEIKNPFKKSKSGYRPTLVTIWHVDPEKDGTDDSCGWFIRLRHADKQVYEKIVREFESEWDRVYESEDNGYKYSCGWFHPDGDNNLSVQGIVFNMYLYAVKLVLDPDNEKPTKTWKQAWKFMAKWHLDITYFAENNRDSISDTITRKFQIGTDTPYTPENRMGMIRDCASTVYTDILRKQRKWYQHPRWHIHHWRIQVNFLRDFWRYYFQACDTCGKRGFRGKAAYGSWGGDKLWCQSCEEKNWKQAPVRNEQDAI